MRRIALDIETACGVGCQTRCDHALDEHRNRITVVGIWDGTSGKVFRDLGELRAHLKSLEDIQLVGHNLKFDLRTLAAKGLDLRPQFADDTLLMAAALTEKIPEDWLAGYERERQRRNSTLTRGHGHRQAGQHSLKTLAPYFLGVEPFWESTETHDNDEYVLADVRYTYELAANLEAKLQEAGAYEFYREKLLPWTRMLLDAEIRGISLDLAALDVGEADAHRQAAEAKRKLDELWAPAYAEHRAIREAEVRAGYTDMCNTALAKNPKDPAKTRARYDALCAKALAKVEPLNLDSPAQLAWLLRDYYGLDIEDFNGEESTGKPVLQGLAGSREDIRVFLDYRRNQKLAQAFFPSYREMHVDGTLHCSFNPASVRTGRLSSSGPNLQQVPGHLHRLFKARPGYKLITRDESAIEPRLIAYFSEDPNLVHIVQSGQDFHGHTTAVLFEEGWDPSKVKAEHPAERKVGKECGLMFMYGAGPRGLQRTAQKYGYIWSLADCKRKLERFKEYYRGVYEFRDNVINPALMRGEPVTNLFGRQFRIPDFRDVHMQGLNTLIQGSASDLVLNSAHRITRAFRERGIDGHVLLLVHDEIVAEVPADRVEECSAIMDHCMTDYLLEIPAGRIPLAVEGNVADYWAK